MNRSGQSNSFRNNEGPNLNIPNNYDWPKIDNKVIELNRTRFTKYLGELPCPGNKTKNMCF